MAYLIAYTCAFAKPSKGTGAATRKPSRAAQPCSPAEAHAAPATGVRAQGEAAYHPTPTATGTAYARISALVTE